MHMTEEVTTTTETTVSENTTGESAQTSPEIDWKAEARKWESRAKENTDKAKEFDSLNSRVSELQAALDEVKAERESAGTELATARLEATRYKVAAKYGVAEEDMELFLTASDEETLEKQAQRLAQHSAALRPDPAQGNRGNTGNPSTNDAFAAAVQGLL